jgi:pimeloyl-ACP methyl ester carboxylesterase
LAGTAEVEVLLGDAGVPGVLTLPPRARGVIVFAHGTGSSRFSPRSAAVAKALIEARFGTLLLDLRTSEEEAQDSAGAGFDLRPAADRVTGAIDWLTCDAVVGDLPPSLAELPVGCFGAGTGAAAALVAAAERPHRVVAVVCRGGRPDLAGPALRRVTAPTLLVVGSRDVDVLRLNRQAQAKLAGESRLEVVPGAGRLFEEPGALERVSTLAREWFLRHIG